MYGTVAQYCPVRDIFKQCSEVKPQEWRGRPASGITHDPIFIIQCLYPVRKMERHFKSQDVFIEKGIQTVLASFHKMDVSAKPLSVIHFQLPYKDRLTPLMGFVMKNIKERVSLP